MILDTSPHHTALLSSFGLKTRILFQLVDKTFESPSNYFLNSYLIGNHAHFLSKTINSVKNYCTAKQVQAEKITATINCKW